MKFIFLDIDGVLNCHTTEEKINSYRGIEEEKIKLLKKIVDASNAKLVLISNWKDNWHKTNKEKQKFLANYLDDRLKEVGLEIYDKTYLNKLEEYNQKGKEILEYLEEYDNNYVDKVENFIILDDQDSDYQKYQITKDRLIKTRFNETGLNERYVDKAIEILSKNNYQLDLKLEKLIYKITNQLQENKKYNKISRSTNITCFDLSSKILVNLSWDEIKNFDKFDFKSGNSVNIHFLISDKTTYISCVTLVNYFSGSFAYTDLSYSYMKHIKQTIYKNKELIYPYL